MIWSGNGRLGQSSFFRFHPILTTKTPLICFTKIWIGFEFNLFPIPILVCPLYWLRYKTNRDLTPGRQSRQGQTSQMYNRHWSWARIGQMWLSVQEIFRQKWKFKRRVQRVAAVFLTNCPTRSDSPKGRQVLTAKGSSLTCGAGRKNYPPLPRGDLGRRWTNRF